METRRTKPSLKSCSAPKKTRSNSPKKTPKSPPRKSILESSNEATKSRKKTFKSNGETSEKVSKLDIKRRSKSIVAVAAAASGSNVVERRRRPTFVQAAVGAKKSNRNRSKSIVKSVKVAEENACADSLEIPKSNNEPSNSTSGVENASKAEEQTTHNTVAATFARVFAGQFNDIPTPLSKLVRVFTSSTFTDTTLERNALMEDVYPNLKRYCRETHGLDFQVTHLSANTC